MPMKLLSADDFRAAAKDGQSPEGTLFKFATTEPVVVGDADSRVRRFVFSDDTVDHSNDSIDPKGWQLDVFKRNPVALFAHMSWDPPIGKASNVKVEGRKLSGDIEFAPPEIYEFGDLIFRLVDGGYLKATSVGFLPKEWAFSSDKDRPYGIDFKKQVLLEISVCPVPCNPNALGEARSAGVDTRPLSEWAEKVLDNGDTVFLPRAELEGLRTQAKGAEPRRYYLQAGKELSAPVAERIRDVVKAWQADPSEVLILPPDVQLRTIDAEGAAVETQIGEVDIDITKAGRRLSAATKAKLQEALDAHDVTAKCIKDLMGEGDTPDDEGGAEEEAVEPAEEVDPDKDLSPEDRRLKEARALKASLPTND